MHFVDLVATESVRPMWTRLSSTPTQTGSRSQGRSLLFLSEYSRPVPPTPVCPRTTGGQHWGRRSHLQRGPQTKNSIWRCRRNQRLRGRILGLLSGHSNVDRVETEEGRHDDDLRTRVPSPSYDPCTDPPLPLTPSREPTERGRGDLLDLDTSHLHRNNGRTDWDENCMEKGSGKGCQRARIKRVTGPTCEGRG